MTRRRVEPADQDAASPPTPGSTGVSVGSRVGRIGVALASVGVLLFTGYAWSSITSLEGNVTRLGGLTLGSGRDGAVDILMVGTDSRVDAQGNPLSAAEQAQLHGGDQVGTNTDTIVVIRIPNDGSSATAISIPRDSYVDVPGIGMSKINAAYGATKEARREKLVEAGTDPEQAEREGTAAGRRALIDSVSALTGIGIDHYAEVGLVGFVLLTDAVGGVDVCLKNSVDEPLSGATFPAGPQTLRGTQALSFVRQRHDLPRGDLDRIARQQVFMASLAQKVLSAGTLADPSKLAALQRAVSRSVVIDDNWDILKFVAQLKDLTGGKVRFATIPVIDEQGWSEDGSQSVVTVDPAAVRRFTAGLLAPKSNRLNRSEYTVDVINAGTVDGLATNVANIVAAKGYQRGTTGNASDPASASFVATGEKSMGATDIARQLGGLPVRVDPSLAPDHLRLVLSDSYTGPGSIADTGARPQATPAAATSPTAPRPTITAAGKGPTCVN
ncbi:LCP family protein [Williamsia sp. CHRR-6]|uniref:LCP family protein n=1 Tax=Williamsia sp. CHRR-6 TaxID=2835871 RepID=UPI0027DDBF67|nr:LCP family protein [Williamsia sp. CHRR-6]